jgi:hypothetical protein
LVAGLGDDVLLLGQGPAGKGVPQVAAHLPVGPDVALANYGVHAAPGTTATVVEIALCKRLVSLAEPVDVLPGLRRVKKTAR